MVREKMIRLSEDEHNELEAYREEEYGTDSIAYGAVIRDLIEEAREE